MSEIRRRPVRRKKRSEKRRRGASTPTRRLANLERLEDRVLLAADFNAWHNYVDPLDVNQDRQVVAVDALIVINDLNRFGSISLRDRAVSSVHSSGGEGEGDDQVTPSGMVDVNGDGALTAGDVLSIVNAFNAAEGEGACSPMNLSMCMASLELSAVEDVVPNVNPFQPLNTPRTVVGTPENPVTMGQTFRLELRAADLRDDDNAVEGDVVTGQFGVYTAYPDISWNDPTGLTVPEDELSFLNGDFGVQDTFQPLVTQHFSENWAEIDSSTPGLLNSTGAGTADATDSFGWGTDTRIDPETGLEEYYNPKRADQ